MIAYDPLGVFADRRITDVVRDADPAASLRQRADDFAPGDTDLAWTRITPVAGRARLGVRQRAHDPAEAVVVDGDPDDPSAQLLAGWLSSRLGFVRAGRRRPSGEYIVAVADRVRRRPRRSS